MKFSPFRQFSTGSTGEAEFIDLGLLSEVNFGRVDGSYGRAAYRYIIEALKLIALAEVTAIVTCPINKAAIREGGIDFIGHTELLAHFAGVSEYVMMMGNPSMKVSLVTIHIPLRDVPTSITSDSVFNCLMITMRSLQDLMGIADPVIKVCGLNPHAGERGLMGSEESIIHRAIKNASALGVNVTGPYPADTLFHKTDCDAYIAMYHDQGLIPVKTVDFKRTVNVTLGLPFIRTSPGHGTGYDIAGTCVADPSSFIEAYRMAERFTKNDSFLDTHKHSVVNINSSKSVI